jgi:hypothetical protein
MNLPLGKCTKRTTLSVPAGARGTIQSKTPICPRGRLSWRPQRFCICPRGRLSWRPQRFCINATARRCINFACGHQPAFAAATAGNLRGPGWPANRSCKAAKIGAGEGNRTLVKRSAIRLPRRPTPIAIYPVPDGIMSAVIWLRISLASDITGFRHRWPMHRAMIAGTDERRYQKSVSNLAPMIETGPRSRL